MTFKEHLQKHLTGFWDKPTVRLKGNEKKLDEQQQNFILLDRGLKANLHEKMERALTDYGIPVVYDDIRFVDEDLKIVEATTTDGKTVHASPNPFQEGVQAFIHEEEMPNKPRENRKRTK